VAVLVVQGVAGTRIAGVAESITVGIGLRGIGDGGAIVVLSRLGRIEAGAGADSVAVLVVQRIGAAGVACVAERIAVRVGLVGVGDGGAIVVLPGLGRVESASRADAVGVLIVQGVAGAGVADVAERVAVGV